MRLGVNLRISRIVAVVLSISILALASANANEDRGHWLKAGDVGWNSLNAATITFQNGEKFKPQMFSGKVLIVNFWGAWCPSCIAEIPRLIEYQKQVGRDKLEIVMVSADDEFQKDISYAQKKRIPFRLAHFSHDTSYRDEANIFQVPYKLDGNVEEVTPNYPTSYIVSASTKIVWFLPGAVPEANTNSITFMNDMLRK